MSCCSARIIRLTVLAPRKKIPIIRDYRLGVKAPPELPRRRGRCATGNSRNRRENLRLKLSDPQTQYNGHQYPCECLKLLRRFPYVDGKHAVRLLGRDEEWLDLRAPLFPDKNSALYYPMI